MTERLSRLIQMYVVLAIGFSIPIVSSTMFFLGRRHQRPASHRNLVFTLIYEGIGLLCLYCVLKYQKRGFGDIGFSVRLYLAEAGHTFVLFFCALLLGTVTFNVLNIVHSFTLMHGSPSKFNNAAIFGSGLSVFAILYVLLSPFYEELLVRAFLITEITQLYQKANLAVFVSVALQTSYHLYQGIPGAFSHIPTFWLFSAYYVRTRRIFPVILAHLLLDAQALSWYAGHLH